MGYDNTLVRAWERVAASERRIADKEKIAGLMQLRCELIAENRAAQFLIGIMLEEYAGKRPAVFLQDKNKLARQHLQGEYTKDVIKKLDKGFDFSKAHPNSLDAASYVRTAVSKAVVPAKQTVEIQKQVKTLTESLTSSRDEADAFRMLHHVMLAELSMSKANVEDLYFAAPGNEHARVAFLKEAKGSVSEVRKIAGDGQSNFIMKIAARVRANQEKASTAGE